jgi:hypothetical protein
MVHPRSKRILREGVQSQRDALILGELASVEIQAIAPGTKPGEGGIRHERMKPFDGTQLVGIQPGQSRSGQAGSECCISGGDLLG